MKPGDLVRIDFSSNTVVDNTRQGKIGIIVERCSGPNAWVVLVGGVTIPLHDSYLKTRII